MGRVDGADRAKAPAVDCLVVVQVVVYMYYFVGVQELRWFVVSDAAQGAPQVKRLAYLTMVKPLMFYGTPAWHPSTQCNVQKFERVQNRALRFVHGRHVSEKARKELLTVHQQLSHNDMTFFRKCLDGETDMDAMERIVVGRTMRI
ncbi:Hypothetical predicted protein [Cloeon dipterum]|uniref:Uncharacterized protein n=1 Tax=Cloeon dipterum TaxID=197152 RepID=A0A8S1CIP1_9INSE|nr:Hypothetical predicted protein [Cloeon dipterum]